MSEKERDQAVRELAEELFVLSRQRPGTPYGRERMAERLHAFLAEREAGWSKALVEAREEGFQAGRRSMASRIKARAERLGG